jgi:hypothetical protein
LKEKPNDDFIIILKQVSDGLEETGMNWLIELDITRLNSNISVNIISLRIRFTSYRVFINIHNRFIAYIGCVLEMLTMFTDIGINSSFNTIFALKKSTNNSKKGYEKKVLCSIIIKI